MTQQWQQQRHSLRQQSHIYWGLGSVA